MRKTMECKPEFKTLRSRLDNYGLADRENQLVDISLEGNQQLALSMQDPEVQEYIVTLRPKSPYDLKKWIGIPDHAVGSSPSLASETHSAPPSPCAPRSVFTPQLQIVPSDPEMQVNLSSFLLRNSSAITQRELSTLQNFIDHAPATSAIGVSVILAQDIYVAAGARLILDKKIQVLFARYITLAATGQIQFQSPFAKIDCAGIRRQSPFATTTIDPHGASTVISRQ